MADLHEARDLAIRMEEYAAQNDLHVALTGGCLYKPGIRKDMDFIIYRHNTPPSLESMANLAERRAAFEDALLLWLDVELVAHHGYLTKVRWRGIPVDLLYPELRKAGEEYMNQEVGPVSSADVNPSPF